jgi:thioredoxin-dependent peroxiredoxin
VEGCGYRDLQAEFDALGVTIVGVGLDAPAENLAWADEEGFGFELWTDDDRVLGVTYGALTGDRDSSVDRVTMLLDANGDLLLEYTEAINVGTHPGLVLEDCERLFGG